jgi:hypothetical protein
MLLAVNEDHTPRSVFRSEFVKSAGAFSPDGKWIAYESNESGAFEVYIHSIQAGEKQRISSNGGFHPRWRSDGKEIFYVTSDNKMMAANIRLDGSLIASPAQMLFPACNAPHTDGRATDYDVTPDGKRFIFPCHAQEVKKRTITVAVQWTSVVKFPASGGH